MNTPIGISPNIKDYCFLTSFLSQSGLRLLKNVCSGFFFSEELSGPWKDWFANSLSCRGRTSWDYWRYGEAKNYLSLGSYPYSRIIPRWIFIPIHALHASSSCTTLALDPGIIFGSSGFPGFNICVHLQGFLRKGSDLGCYLSKGHVYIHSHRFHCCWHNLPRPPFLSISDSLRPRHCTLAWAEGEQTAAFRGCLLRHLPHPQRLLG